MWSKKIAIASILALTRVVSGQSVADNSTLKALISKALSQNPDVLAMAEQWKAAEHKVSPSGALPDPMGMVNLSGPLADSWVGEPMATANVQLGLSQKFPFPGKQGSMKKGARFMASGMAEGYEAARQALAAEVRSAYYDLAYWQAALSTVDENIDLIDELETVARERYKVGLGLQVHVLQAQKTRTRLEDRRLAISQMIETSRWKLGRLVGDASSTGYNAVLPELGAMPLLDHGALRSSALERNPVYKKSEFDIGIYRQRLRRARLEYLPDITLGAAYGFRWENEMFPMFSKDMLMVSAGFNIPLWGGWKQRNMVSSARADLRMSEYKRSDVHNMLVFELEKNLFEYERNSSKFTLYDESLIPQTRATLESARAAYQVGKLEFLDVVTAQMELFEAELEKERSLADALKALAAIDKLTADAVPSDAE